MNKCGKKLSAAMQCGCIALLTIFVAASAGAQTTAPPSSGNSAAGARPLSTVTHDATLQNDGTDKSPLGVAESPVAGRLPSAAPAPQQFHRPLTFEPNQGQAPAQFKWLGQSSSYQVLLDGESATVVIPDKTDLQAASMRLPGTRPPFHLKYSAVRMKLAGSQPWEDIT